MIRNDCIETIDASITWKDWARAGVRKLRDDLVQLMNLLVLWQRRFVDRKRLREMDERLLKDMGIGRIDALRESAKPFWLE